MVGIYKITSPSGKVYIGQSLDIKNRFRNYKYLVCSKEQVILHRSFKKYGYDKHTFEIITECDIDDLNSFERYYQELYNCLGKKGMNCRLTKTKDRSGKLSEETKRKMSEVRKGVPHSAERKAKSKGKDCSYMGGSGRDNPFFGRKHSVETKGKISKANTGNKYCVGRVLSVETKDKISKAHTRKIINTETGEIYNSRKELAEKIGMNPSTLRNKLNGSNRVKINYEYI